MKNKKAQLELEPIPLMMGLFGGILAWWMSSRMGAGFVLKLFSTLLTMVVGYFVAYFIANK